MRDIQAFKQRVLGPLATPPLPSSSLRSECALPLSLTLSNFIMLCFGVIFFIILLLGVVEFWFLFLFV